MWIFNSFKQCWRYLRSLFWRKPMDRGVFADIEETHGQEEKLRQESMALVAADPELSRRLEMVQKAIALIFGYASMRVLLSASMVSIFTRLLADILGSVSYANSVSGFSSSRIGWWARSPT